MYYYVDESGNWSDGERHRLLIGAIVSPDKSFEKEMKRELRILKNKFGLGQLHAADMNRAQRNAVYHTISNALDHSGSRVYVRIYPKEIIDSSTKREREEIYSECAADLMRIVALGDEKIEVFYDLKFYYAYPANVLSHMKRRRPFYMKRAIDYFDIKEEELLKARNMVLSKLEGIVSKRGVSDAERKKAAEGIDILTNNGRRFDCLDSRTLETSKGRIRGYLSKYLWTEMDLQIEGQDRMRGRFEKSIAMKLNEALSMFSVDTDTPPEISLNFLNKSSRDPAVNGINAIDFICNLVYQKGTRPSPSVESAELGIYDRITIEEVSS